MILISNIGNRDILYQDRALERDKVRQIGEELFNNYDAEKENLAYPLLEPLLRTFANKLNNIYIFVTNQEDQRVRNSDTLFLGEIIKKWIRDTYNIRVNVIQYANNPTDYERVYGFFTAYFTQEESIIGKAKKRIISLSGGTPQMNGALYIILSSLYLDGNEFYNIFEGELIPVNHEKTINKILVKKSCLDLLKINKYQSIVELLKKSKLQNNQSLVLLLKYAQQRKNFDFEKAQEHLEHFLELIPMSLHQHYQIFSLQEKPNPLDLIKELFWNMETSYKNQNYLFFVALLFRLEEALLYEINNYLFKQKFKKDLNEKKNHHAFSQHLENEELNIWNSLQKKYYKTLPLKIDPDDLGRPVFFYIATLKLENQRVNDRPIKSILEVFDKVNKYCYNELDEEERIQKYKDKKSTECLGDLRNSSIIAHGFMPVSKEKIEKLYGESIENLYLRLKTNLKQVLGQFLDNKPLNLNNIFDEINKKIEILIYEL